ncbi:hypothetical protein F383_02691 [Gossypium arboreum]|uniref:Uncharacterized protein n=1 Tax=Gossypium arboreum TaxID=29729 RepID=A0A0B0NLS5_GOSAR|nr:hypothetical protein F383_18021 [Gossypium arboreum]KHG14031.1 hypothetical protein F383_02691 [Gossypium arboreum]
MYRLWIRSKMAIAESRLKIADLISMYRLWSIFKPLILSP